MEFGLVRALGVIVVEVPGLSVGLAYDPRVHVLMIREGLTHEQRVAAADWTFEEATQGSWIPGRPL